jgi:dihydropteridine reductase
MSGGRVIVYGGRGALGSKVVSVFKEAGYWVLNIDLKESEESDQNIIVSGDSWTQQEENVCSAVTSALGGEKVDAVLCLAGGWAGGSPASPEFIKNAELMWKSSVWPASISARLACIHLKDGGAIVLPGAQPGVKGTPTMAGYGMAKAAVHQLVFSMGEEKTGLHKDSLSVAILPNTLDTPMNRKWMPKADTSTWTPLEFVAELMLKWTRAEERPASGSLVSLLTEAGVTRTTT